jgi:hypothetical protein
MVKLAVEEDLLQISGIVLLRGLRVFVVKFIFEK